VRFWQLFLLATIINKVCTGRQDYEFLWVAVMIYATVVNTALQKPILKLKIAN